MGLEYAIEESCEDALAAYLKANLPGDMLVTPAWTTWTLQYPCVIVHAGMSGNWNDQAVFNWRRKIEVNVGIKTEAKSVKDDGGVTIRLAREQNRAVRAAVTELLGKAMLHEELNAMNIPGILFSTAYMMGVTRSVDGPGRIFESSIVIEVIAQPTAI